MRSSWYLILIFGCIGVIRSAIRLIEGRYNRMVLISTLVTNVIGAVIATLWLTRPGLINPEFISHIQMVLADENTLIQNIFAGFDTFFLVIILFALFLDTIEATVKTFKK